MRTPHSALVLLVVALTTACAPAAPRSVAGPPSIEGRITAVERSGDGTGTIRVEANPSESSGSDKAVVRITPSTEIQQGDSARVNFNALSKGLWARVWFVGPVRESYPVQADAGRIVIDPTR